MTLSAAFVAGAAAGALTVGAFSWAYVRRHTGRFARLFSFAMHEINTPVTAVNMTVLNLLSGAFFPLPDPLKPWLEMTRDQVDRLSGLIATTRDFVHMELHGDLLVSYQSLPAQTLCDGALRSVRIAMRQAEIEFVVESEPGLPAVRTDPERAVRCLIDVLFHARKFRAAGPVSMRSRRTARGVEFVVGYEASAVEAREASSCLDLYYPARRRGSQTLTATGLGLGMTRELARRIGGDLSFRVSDEGRATLILSFTVVEEPA